MKNFVAACAFLALTAAALFAASAHAYIDPNTGRSVSDPDTSRDPVTGRASNNGGSSTGSNGRAN